MPVETFVPKASQNIAQVDYDAETQLLTVTFQDGRAYEYTSVPEAVFTGLKEAPSVGSYFHRQVKGVYAYTEV